MKSYERNAADYKREITMQAFWQYRNKDIYYLWNVVQNLKEADLASRAAAPRCDWTERMENIKTNLQELNWWKTNRHKLKKGFIL